MIVGLFAKLHVNNLKYSNNINFNINHLQKDTNNMHNKKTHTQKYTFFGVPCSVCGALTDSARQVSRSGRLVARRGAPTVLHLPASAAAEALRRVLPGDQVRWEED